MLSEWLPFGLLGRAHGVTGEIAVEPFNSLGKGRVLPTPLDAQLVRGTSIRSINLIAARPVHGGFLLRFTGVDDRDAATALSGHQLHLPRAIFAPLAAGEFYVADTIGCEVVRTDGTPMGRITGTFWNGAQDVLAVVAADGTEHLIPAVTECIRGFDAHCRRLIVDYHD